MIAEYRARRKARDQGVHLFNPNYQHLHENMGRAAARQLPVTKRNELVSKVAGVCLVAGTASSRRAVERLEHGDVPSPVIKVGVPADLPDRPIRIKAPDVVSVDERDVFLVLVHVVVKVLITLS